MTIATLLDLSLEFVTNAILRTWMGKFTYRSSSLHVQPRISNACQASPPVHAKIMDEEDLTAW